MKTVINTLLNGKVKIVQFETGLKVSSDAVLVASAIDEKIIKKSATILDVGVGGGGISLCTAYKFKNVKITGIDIQNEMLELAKQSCIENGFDDRIELINENILNPSKQFKEKSFDIVITNPPYYKGQSCSDKIKAIAHNETGIDLKDWILSSVKRLNATGTFIIIHKADRLDDIIYSLKKANMGKIEIFLLYSKKGEIANRVIVRAKKSNKSPSVIYPPIVLHKENGEYTDRAKSLLCDGKAIG